MRKTIIFVILLILVGFAAVLVNFSIDRTHYIKTREVLANHPDSIELLVDSLVAPILYHEIEGIDQLPPDQAKLKFISALLPSILLAKHRIEDERNQIREILNKPIWLQEDSAFYFEQSEFYKTASGELLLRRMKTHPNSIILAQAAVESGWGTSRIFQQANNLFGIWSYRSGEPRIKSIYSRNGQAIYLRKYDDVSASIYGYFGLVARSRAYRRFREARDTTDNVNVLLPYLKYYSERREEYVEQLATIIRQNRMTQYDDYRLDPAYFVEERTVKLFGYVIDTVVVVGGVIVDDRQ
ncbi:MAG: glucosaminidase domain-containing protein [Imperialibacter sp.]|uniref:glucosaminidase domain-containing protein n=1 Tax=Imperialibacter sp. TaxID=2038411 RepID=UPI0032EBC341